MFEIKSKCGGAVFCSGDSYAEAFENAVAIGVSLEHADLSELPWRDMNRSMVSDLILCKAPVPTEVLEQFSQIGPDTIWSDPLWSEGSL